MGITFGGRQVGETAAQRAGRAKEEKEALVMSARWTPIECSLPQTGRRVSLTGPSVQCALSIVLDALSTVRDAVCSVQHKVCSIALYTTEQN